MRRILAIAGGAALLAGCHLLPAGQSSVSTDPVDTPTEQTDPDITSPLADKVPPAVPLEVENDLLSASVEIPAELQVIAPRLDAALREEAINDINQLERDASESMDESFFRPFSLQYTWDMLAKSGDLISLRGFKYYDTAGAHPNYIIEGRLYDAGAQLELMTTDLFIDPAFATQQLVPALKAEIVRLKTERHREWGDAEGAFASEVDDLFKSRLDWLEAATPVASDREGQFGGLVVLFSPYDIGAYAEGSYEAVLPSPEFNRLLKPEYRALFSGAAIYSDEF